MCVQKGLSCNLACTISIRTGTYGLTPQANFGDKPRGCQGVFDCAETSLIKKMKLAATDNNI